MKLKGCRLTEKQQDRLVEFFVGEMTVRTAADLVGINKTTGAYFFHRLRAIIAWQSVSYTHLTLPTKRIV